LSSPGPCYTGHGNLFHGAVDGYIEEEWTFYQAPQGAPAAVMLPSASFFNSPTRRSSLFCTHLKTVGDSQRAELLAHFSGPGKIDVSPRTGILYVRPRWRQSFGWTLLYPAPRATPVHAARCGRLGTCPHRLLTDAFGPIVCPK